MVSLKCIKSLENTVENSVYMRTIPPWLNNIETTGRAFWTKIESRKEVTFTPKLMKTSKSKKQYQDSHQYTVKRS